MFRVIWTAGALDDLADAWRNADAGQRQAVTLASNIIDEKLRTDPLGSSESRDDEDRVNVRGAAWYPVRGRSFQANRSSGPRVVLPATREIIDS